MSSCPTVPTSTTLRRATRLPRMTAPPSRSSPAARWRAAAPRSSPAAGGRWTCTRCRRCCTTSRSASPVRCASSPGAWRRDRRWPSATPTAARTARSTRCAPARPAAARRPALLRRVRRRRTGWRRSSPRSPAPTCSPTSWSARSPGPCWRSWPGPLPRTGPDYFGHYRRVVWLAQDRDPALEAEAGRIASRFGLPLTVVDTGTGRLERELALLVGAP